MFLVVGHQVCTHLRRAFVPLLFADPLQVIKVSMTRTFSSLHIFSMGLRSGDWQGHSRTLMCFFLSHSFVALAMCYVYGRMLCVWLCVFFNALALTVHGPFDAVQLSWTLSRKTPPKHNVSTSMFDGGDGVPGS